MTHSADNCAARTEIAQAIKSKHRVFAQQPVDSQQAAGGSREQLRSTTSWSRPEKQ